MNVKKTFSYKKRSYSLKEKNPNKYVCSVCNKSFSTSAILRIHSYQHSGVKKHICEICGERFIEQYLLNKHFEIHKGNILPNVCEFCNKTYSSKNSLAIHRAFHMGVVKEINEEIKDKNKSIKEILSEKPKTDIEPLPNEVKKESDENILQSNSNEVINENIDASQKITETKSNEVNDENIDENHEIVSYVVQTGFGENQEIAELHYDEVNKCFFVNQEVVEVIYEEDLNNIYVENQLETNQSHQEISIEQQSEVDQPQQKEISSADQSKRVESRYNCTICNEVFYSLSLLEEHITCHSEEILSCDICNVKFSNSSELSTHYAIHTSETKFSCEFCNAGFPAEADLKQHKLVKHKPSPFPKRFKCDICQKRFEKSVQLDQHYSIHIGGKPFLCEVCNVRYALKSHYEKHNHVEHPPFSDETNKSWKRYSCDHCPLGFVLKLNFDRHSSTHKQKRKFGCGVCDASFSSLERREEHYLKHVDEQYALFDALASHGCSVCLKLFPTVCELEEHKLISHLESVKTAAVNIGNVDKMLSDVAKCESDFILNENFNKHSDSSQSNPVNITNNTTKDGEGVNVSQSDVSVALDPNVESQPENNVETFYIITENEDGTFESSILDSNCVIVIDEQQEIQDASVNETEAFEENRNVAENVEISAVAQSESQFTESSPNSFRTWNCDVCHKTFQKKSRLRYHSYTHTGERPYSCNVCSKSFGHKSSLNLHVATHKAVKPCPCDTCGKTFATKYRLKLHSVCHEENKFICDICGMGLRNKHNLRFHIYKHTGFRPFKCDICDLGFIRKHEFEKHQKFHRGEPLSHTCEDCGKICRSGLHLKHHRLQHTGEKPYPCDLCPKGFTSKASLKNHYVKHTKEGRYRCNVCGKPFHILDRCIKHMQTHTGTRNFHCDICGAGFTQKMNLRAHYVKHTKKDPYACDLCNICFKTLKDLRIHRQKIHQDKRWPSTREDTAVLDPNMKMGHLAVLEVREVVNPETEEALIAITTADQNAQSDNTAQNT